MLRVDTRIARGCSSWAGDAAHAWRCRLWEWCWCVIVGSSPPSTACERVFVHEPKKAFYKTFRSEPFPVESHLHTLWTCVSGDGRAQGVGAV